MSTDDLNKSMPEPSESATDIDKKIAALRQRLTTDAAAWPESANALFTDLAASPAEMEDDVMLTFIVQDALHGVDVPRKYPQAYRRLLSNGRLRQTFLDLLTALEPDQASDMPPLPKADLSFLQTAVSPQPIIHHSSSGWQAAWQLLGDYLTKCFPAPSTLAYRATFDDLLEEQDIILIDDEFNIDHMRVNVLLEANLDIDIPDTLTISLLLAAFSNDELPPLKAALKWGSYEATAVLDTQGQALFPPLSAASVLDKNREVISANLDLVLEAMS
jgi:hypothetical protein